MTAGKLVREVRIVNRYGMHSRPAALFVNTAMQFKADIQVQKKNLTVSGKSIMGLLTIEGHLGSTLKLMAEGKDAAEALDALQKLFENKFYEE